MTPWPSFSALSNASSIVFGAILNLFLIATILGVEHEATSGDRPERVYECSYSVGVDDEWFEYPDDPYQLDEIGVGHVTSLDGDGVGTFLSVLITAHSSQEEGNFHFVVSPEDGLKVAALLIDAVVLSKSSAFDD